MMYDMYNWGYIVLVYAVMNCHEFLFFFCFFFCLGESSYFPYLFLFSFFLYTYIILVYYVSYLERKKKYVGIT